MRWHAKTFSREAGLALIAVMSFGLLLSMLIAISGRRANDLRKEIDLVEKQQINRLLPTGKNSP